MVLISGNIPFKTEVASVYIFGQLESGNGAGGRRVSVVLLAISLGRAAADRRLPALGDEA